MELNYDLTSMDGTFEWIRFASDHANGSTMGMNFYECVVSGQCDEDPREVMGALRDTYGA